MSTQFPPGAPPPPNAYQAPFGQQAPPPRRSPLWWILIGAVAAMCCCGLPCIGVLGPTTYVLVKEGAAAQQEITGFLEDLNAGRTDSALARFSANAVTEANLTRDHMVILSGEPNFQGATKASVSSINVRSNYNSDPKVPQGVFADASGSVTYTGGEKGTFKAALQKEDGKWRLRSLEVQRGSGTPTRVGVPSVTAEAN